MGRNCRRAKSTVTGNPKGERKYCVRDASPIEPIQREKDTMEPLKESNKNCAVHCNPASAYSVLLLCGVSKWAAESRGCKSHAVPDVQGMVASQVSRGPDARPHSFRKGAHCQKRSHKILEENSMRWPPMWPPGFQKSGMFSEFAWGRMWTTA